MTVLIVGVTGATGRLLLAELLSRGHQVRGVVRSLAGVSETLRAQKNFSPLVASITELSHEELLPLVEGCDAVVSCLGHTLTVKGMLGHPRYLVTDVVRELFRALEAHSPERHLKTKLILMNSVGNRNKDLNEPLSRKDRIILGLLELLLPPHRDNVQAADFLRQDIGQEHSSVEWSAVRPASLTNDQEVSSYKVFPDLQESALSGTGKTSRINVAHFMAELITNEATWKQWKGQMPTLYNA